ncbi:hypothetical protein Tco_0101859, partial [Tanacetum coccineum]
MVTQKPRRPKKKNTQVPQSSVPSDSVADEAVYKELDDSLATPNEAGSQGTTSGGGPRRQETMGDTIAQTSLKRRVNRLKKKGGSRTHELKRLYKVGLSRRVESSDEEGLRKEDASKQGMIDDLDADVGINLVSTYFDAGTNMFGVHDLVGEEVVVKSGVHDLVGDEVVVKIEVVVKAASTIPVSATTTTTTVITNDEI